MGKGGDFTVFRLPEKGVGYKQEHASCRVPRLGRCFVVSISGCFGMV
ncbi:hypothetical protein GCWU000324_00593 [Kingella oralis ATCC 51147]|uniref:Uncharacterized protein n=1 Tax=Kingella oralis ATCC 51147 TaxID=629741 RepID=C4GIA1_9NEIS|nr:hypothetical protein GCWU000324_00593 [Kingella oralis ATCC 51147]